MNDLSSSKQINEKIRVNYDYSKRDDSERYFIAITIYGSVVLSYNEKQELNFDKPIFGDEQLNTDDWDVIRNIDMLQEMLMFKAYIEKVKKVRTVL